MVPGGRGVLDQAAKKQLQARAKGWVVHAITELNGGNTRAAIEDLKHAIAECEKIVAQE
jgi:hypothetical protein